MAETHDFGADRYLTTIRYPKGAEPPLREEGVETRETEPPFRIGHGISYRIPLTRRAVVLGRWIDDGGPEVERLEAALGASQMDTETEEIRSW